MHISIICVISVPHYMDKLQVDFLKKALKRKMNIYYTKHDFKSLWSVSPEKVMQ